jgi:drug/metabolite transporter (DMT)-like permease
MGYLYILLTVFLTAYGQLILKWRMNALNQPPAPLLEKFWFLFRIIFDPFIFSGFFAAFLASLTWMAALSRFQLSFAYPFMSLAFVVVMLCSYVFLDEALTAQKILGLALIIVGLVVASR